MLPADDRLLGMTEAIFLKPLPYQRGPVIIWDPRNGPARIRSPRDNAGIVPLTSSGELTMVTVTIGRSAPAELVEAAKRYIKVSGSTIPPYELALAAHDD